MASKEELIKQLRELTKRQVRMDEEKTQITLRNLPKHLEEMDTIHQKRIEIWREIAQINEEEQQMRGHI